MSNKKEDLNFIKNDESLGGFWYRFCAFLIDYALIIFIGFVIGFGATVAYPELAILIFDIPTTLLGIIMIIGYHAIFLSKFSFTPGKKLFGLRVVDSKTGNNISIGQSLGRSVSYFISSLFFGLGFWVIAFKSSKRGWHDSLAGTHVIKEDTNNLITAFLLTIVSVAFIVGFIYWDQISTNSEVELNTKSNFIEGCTIYPGMNEYCECAYDYFIDNYGEDELINAGLKMKGSGNLTPEMEETITACEYKL